MKPEAVVIVYAVSLLLGWPAIGWTEDGESEPVITQEAQQLDEQALVADGEQQVVQRLTKEFGVEEARIASLREQRLGYGEVHHVLSLAQQMPNGITDDNVNTIMRMRQEQHMGWGTISKTLLNQPLGQAISPQGITHRGGGVPSAHATSRAKASSRANDARHRGQPLNMHGPASGHGGWNPGQSAGRSSSAPGRTR